MDTTAISISLDTSLRVIQRELEDWEKYGDVCKERAKKGQPPILQGDAARVSTESHSEAKVIMIIFAVYAGFG
jgi:hypothetical protein